MRLNKKTYARATLILIVSSLLLALLYPKREQARFKYRYTLNQPWRYEDVVIAPFDFDIRKSADKIQAEKSEIESTMIEYYTLQPQVYIQQKNRLTEAYNNDSLPGELINHSGYMRYLLDELEKIYTVGIIEERTDVQVSDTTQIYVIGTDNVAKSRTGADVLTQQQAYNRLLEDLPEGLDSLVLHQASISSYLTPNLYLDENKTDQMLEARKSAIEEVIGKVSKGEKIVGQGEEVTPEVFQKLESYRQAYEQMSVSKEEVLLQQIGIFLLITLLLTALLLYFVAFRKNVLADTQSLLFIFAFVVFFTGLTYLLVPLAPAVVYIIPYCMIAILVRIFIDSRTAFVTFLMTVLTSALIVPDQLEFIILNIVAGRIATVTLRNLSQRSDLIRTTFYVFITIVVTYIIYSVAMGTSLQDIRYIVLLYFAVNLVFLMFSYSMVYLVERGFGFVSNISLVELADINKPLLRRLSEVAPGTFQHSLNVSILSSAAIAKIGGDVQLIRSGALYHDIGKMRNPIYFTENQASGINPHDNLSYDESARLIIKHVTDGVEMAEKAKLPTQIIDFIRTHHGLGMTKYFYIQYKNSNPDKVIDETVFHYPGPNPSTKEQGVLMLADIVEASSRSLDDLTEEKLVNHVTKTVDGVVASGMLKNTPLTFRNIEIIKQVFIDKLRTMNHSRIKYPELKTTAATTEES